MSADERFQPATRLFSLSTAKAFLGLAVLILAVHGRAVTFDFTRTDDKALLIDEADFLRDLSNIPEALRRPFFPVDGRGESYYRPLVAISHMLDAQWAGTNPVAYHVTNLLLHLLTTGLLFLLLRRLGFQALSSWIGAALFAVHPALTSAVVWIPGRADILIGLFFLGMWLFYHDWSEAPARKNLGGLLACFLLGLFSKEAFLVAPLALVAYSLAVGRKDILRRSGLWLGWGAVAVVWFLLRRIAVGGMAGESPAERLAVLARHLHVLVLQFGKAVFPYKLSVLAIIGDTPWIPGVLGLAAALIAAGYLRGRDRRLFLWGLLAFFLFLLPTLPVSDYVISETRLYASMIGVAISLTALLHGLSRRGQPMVSADRDDWGRLGPGRFGKVMPVAAGAAILLLAVASFRYGAVFRDPDSYSAAAVAGSPHSSLAHQSRGIVLHLAGRVPEAEREYARALELDPNQMIANNNLGVVCLNRNDLVAAEKYIRREIEINPEYPKAHFNLGLVFKEQGRWDDAAAAWRRTLQLNGENTGAMKELVLYHLRKGESDEASRMLKELEARGITPYDW